MNYPIKDLSIQKGYIELTHDKLPSRLKSIIESKGVIQSSYSFPYTSDESSEFIKFEAKDKSWNLHRSLIDQPLITVPVSDSNLSEVDSPTKLFKYAYNDSGVDKTWNMKMLTNNFIDTEGDLNSVISHIKNGHAICAGLLAGKNRAGINFAGSHWVLVDIDNSAVELDDKGNTVKVYKPEFTLEQALEHTFIKSYCALIYTTTNHTPDWHRFRLIFLLPDFIKDRQQYESVLKKVMGLFPSDNSCSDCIRVFYGSTKAVIPLNNPSVCLPTSFVSEAILEADRENNERDNARKVKCAAYQSSNHKRQEGNHAGSSYSQDDLIKLALSYIPARCYGANNYQQSFKVLAALHWYYGEEEALPIAESWSPSQPPDPSGKAGTWDVKYKLSTLSSDRNTVTSLGTLFHISKKYGYIDPRVKTKPDVECLTEDEQLQVKASLDDLIAKKKVTLDISSVLPIRLARLLKRQAELKGSTQEVLLTLLLPVIASCVKIGTRLELSEASDWYAKPIIWTGMVGGASTSKSPSLNTVLDPLREIQKGFTSEYEEKKARWVDLSKEDQKSSDKPVMRILYTDDITLEALASIQNNQRDSGCLLPIDELSGLLDGANQYKGGKGNDKQKLLSIRDGKPFSITRGSKDPVFTQSSGFSITGGIQPSVLKQQMGDFTDGDGYWSRFLWANLPLLRPEKPTDADRHLAKELKKLLGDLYRLIMRWEPNTYKLSEDAEKVFDAYRDELDDERMNNDNGVLKICNGKAKSNVGEIALLLHILFASVDELGQPEKEVSVDIALKAVDVMRFYLIQAEIIQTLGEEVRGEERPLQVAIIELSKKSGWINAKCCKNSIWALKSNKTQTPDIIRQKFIELSDLGMGEIKGEGKSLEFKAF